MTFRAPSAARTLSKLALMLTFLALQLSCVAVDVHASNLVIGSKPDKLTFAELSWHTPSVQFNSVLTDSALSPYFTVAEHSTQGEPFWWYLTVSGTAQFDSPIPPDSSCYLWLEFNGAASISVRFTNNGSSAIAWDAVNYEGSTQGSGDVGAPVQFESTNLIRQDAVVAGPARLRAYTEEVPDCPTAKISLDDTQSFLETRDDAGPDDLQLNNLKLQWQGTKAVITGEIQNTDAEPAEDVKVHVAALTGEIWLDVGASDLDIGRVVQSARFKAVVHVDSLSATISIDARGSARNDEVVTQLELHPSRNHGWSFIAIAAWSLVVIGIVLLLLPQLIARRRQ